MNAYWIIFCVSVILATVALTHHIDNAFYEAAQERQLKEAIAATQKAQEATNALVGTEDAKIANFASETDLLKGKYHATTPDNCTLHADRLRFLGATANAARRAAR